MTPGRTKRTIVLGIAIAAFGISGHALAAPPGECPDTMPIADVTAGLTGEGWTVAQGADPEPFDVTVLGVVPDGVAPGHDMIIVDTSSAKIDEIGGIWAGMSGSPVYIGGKLVGALAYGFTLGPSPIAGLTPASDLLSVDGYSTFTRPVVHLTRSLARRVARAAGTSVRTTLNSTRLKTPLSVSGVSARVMPRVDRLIKRLHMSAFAVPGPAASSSLTASSADVAPGGNFVAAASYGDITFAGVGTTSWVCDGHAVAFGHPFSFAGPTTLGANVGDAITIIDDPTLTPYKMATIGGSVGLLDQDRLSGIRAILGPPPDTTPVVANLRNLDSGRSRRGETDVVMPELLPDLAFFHLFSDTDVVNDRIGKGTARFGWTIKGRRADGAPWTFRRGNMYASLFDISFESSFDLANELYSIANNGVEKVTVDSVNIGGSVEEAIRMLEIVKVLAKRGGTYHAIGSGIRVEPGHRLHLRVVMRPFESQSLRRVDLSIWVPRTVRRGGFLEVGNTGGGQCQGEGCEGMSTPASFPKLLESFRAQPRNNVLVAQIRSGRNFGVKSRTKVWLDSVVSGARTAELRTP